ncbi:MAG TPA: hypothetical protein GYA10_06965 [Alphaproteobacteria bacterium]|nr:hypothetical protein [Alphaproteobacteria bacterium]
MTSLRGTLKGVSSMRTLVLIALSAVLATSAEGVELKPLRDVAAEELSEAALVFTMNRCAGAYMAAADTLRIDGGGQYEDTITTLQASSEIYAQLALASGTAGEEALRSNIRQIAEMYFEEMKQSYFATGNRFEGTVRDDISFCGDLLRQLGGT